jgi:hypothetical protein
VRQGARADECQGDTHGVARRHSQRNATLAHHALQERVRAAGLVAGALSQRDNSSWLAVPLTWTPSRPPNSSSCSTTSGPRLSKNPSNVPLTPEQARELDDRDVDLERDIKAGKPWGEPWSDARERL